MQDSFIAFRYAKNLVEGHGLRWNPNEEPVEGYTNFLLVLLCALALKAGFGLPIFSQILGGVSAFLTGYYAYRFSRKIMNWPAAASLLPCQLLSLSGPFATWAGSGMETNLFTLLLMAAIYHFADYFKSNQRKHLYLCFLFLFLSTLTRPEGFGVFAFFIGVSLAVILWHKKPFRHFPLPILSYVLPFCLYFAWRVSYFGYLLPNTYYAKTGGTIFQYLRGLRYTGSFLFFFALPFLFLILFLAWERRKTFVKRNAASLLAPDGGEKTGLYLCGTSPYSHLLHR